MPQPPTSATTTRRGVRPLSLWAALLVLATLVAIPAGAPQAGAQGDSPAPWLDDDRSERVRLRVDADVDGPLADFPVLVRLDDTRIDASATGPDDLHFLTDDGTTLPHEVETWDPEGESAVWVRVPELDDDTAWWLYYDGTSPAPGAGDVHPDGVGSVYHLAEEDGPLVDAAAGHDAAVTGTVGHGADGRVGPGLGMLGTGHAEAGEVGGGGDGLTVSAWVDRDSLDGSWQGFVTRDLTGGAKAGEVFYLGANGSTTYGRVVTTDGASDTQTTVSAPAATGWQHLTVRYDGAAVSLWVDGAEVASTPASGTVAAGDATVPLTLAAYSGGDLPAADAVLDEVRVADVARPDGWIHATYLSESDQLLAYDDASDAGPEPLDPDAPWADDDRAFRVGLTVAAAVDEPVEGLPVPVRLDADQLDTSVTTPDELHVLSADGTTTLPHEVESWDPDGESVIWVRPPSVQQGTAFWLYYGGGEPVAQPGPVWDDAFASVHHLQQAEGDVLDATTNAADGTVHGDVDRAVAGQVGPATGFHGGRADIGAVGGGTDGLTVSAWVHRDDLGGSWQGFVTRDLTGGAHPGEVFFLGAQSGTTYGRVVTADGSGGTSQHTVTSAGATGWQHVAIRYDGTALTLWADGRQVGSQPATGTVAEGDPTGVPTTIGAYSSTDLPFDGLVDEVQISDVARSDAWMRASYLTTATGSVTVGTPQSADGTLVVGLTSPRPGDVHVDGTVEVRAWSSVPSTFAYAVDGGAATPVDQPVGTALSVDLDVAELGAGPHEVEVTATAADDPGEVDTASVVFAVSGEAPPAVPADPSPAPDAEDVPTDAELSVAVDDPTGDAVDVEFLQVASLRPTADAGTTGRAPVPPAPGDDVGTPLTADDLAAVAAVDGQALTTDGTDAFPFQRYDFQVPDGAADGGVIELSWTGRSLPGRTVGVYGWDTAAARWTALVSQADPDGDAMTLTAEVPPAVVDGDVVHLLVQDRIGGSADYMAEPGPPTQVDDGFPAVPDEGFSMAFTTDTQFYSEAFPEVFESMNTWIADNAEQKRIAYTFHTGDVIQNPGAPPGSAQTQLEWERADDAMAILEDAGVPYGVTPGNHDNSSGANDELYNQHFGPARFEGRGWYGEPWREGDNRSHYDLLDVDGVEFVILYLGYGISQEEFDWANEVLARYADRNAIIGVHEYLNAGGGFSGQGQDIFEQVIVPNENVFLLLCGHIHGVAYNVKHDVGAEGRTVIEMLADYQSATDDQGRRATGYFRLLTFDTAASEMEVTTYSAYLDDFDYYSPAEESFTLDVDLERSDKLVATDAMSLSVRTDEVIGTASDVPAGTRATTSWEGLAPGTAHGWYARATDPTGGVATSPVWWFTTAGTPPDDGGPTPGGPGGGDPGGDGQDPELPGSDEDPQPEPPGPDEQPAPEPPTVRIAGSDRIGTAIATSQAGFADGSAGAVVLSRADEYADALAGTSLAAAVDAPLLLTDSAALPPDVLAEVQRVLPAGGTVHVLGGEAAIAAAVDDALRDAGYVVERIAGTSRYDTAVAIAERTADPGVVLIASGTDFPDALTASAAAAHAGGVVVLTAGEELPAPTAAYLEAHGGTDVYAIGGPAGTAVPGVSRIAGATRVHTAALVARQFFHRPTVAGLATGADFPDALSGGSQVGRAGGPVLLTWPDRLAAPVADFLGDHAPTIEQVMAYGGTTVLPEAVVAEAAALIG